MEEARLHLERLHAGSREGWTGTLSAWGAEGHKICIARRGFEPWFDCRVGMTGFEPERGTPWTRVRFPPVPLKIIGSTISLSLYRSILLRTSFSAKHRYCSRDNFSPAGLHLGTSQSSDHIPASHNPAGSPLP